MRRVYIPKADGKRRSLGIPAIEDKIVQMGVTRIFQAIFEVDFLDCSYGFRPNRDCHQALNTLDKMIMQRPVNYVIDADIKGFFDNVDHDWLMRCIEQRISDKNLLRLLKRFLRAGIIEEGKYISSEKGTPQGGIISPVLADIYLHYVLDLGISCFYHLTIRLVFKWLNRRSQKKSYNWEQFKVYFLRHSLPKPRIYHNLYTLYGYKSEY